MKIITAVFVIPHGDPGDEETAERLAYLAREAGLGISRYDNEGGSIWVQPETVHVMAVGVDGSVESAS